MDIRAALSANENFKQKLKDCFENKEKVSMILDDGGLTRAEGVITNIFFDTQPAYIELHDGTKVNVHAIVAINGTFLSDYSEC
jgi:hypothetical protein